MARDTDEVLVTAGVWGCLTVVVTPLIFLLSAAGLLLEAWVATHLWEWFVVPSFDVPSLSMVAAVGVSLLVALWTNHYRDYKRSESNWSILEALCHMFLRPLISLGFGYVAYTYFM